MVRSRSSSSVRATTRIRWRWDIPSVIYRCSPAEWSGSWRRRVAFALGVVQTLGEQVTQLAIDHQHRLNSSGKIASHDAEIRERWPYIGV